MFTFTVQGNEIDSIRDYDFQESHCDDAQDFFACLSSLTRHFLSFIYRFSRCRTVYMFLYDALEHIIILHIRVYIIIYLSYIDVTHFRFFIKYLILERLALFNIEFFAKIYMLVLFLPDLILIFRRSKFLTIVMIRQRFYSNDDVLTVHQALSHHQVSAFVEF